MHRAITRILRLFGYRKTFGGAVVSTRYLRPIPDREAREIKEQMRIDDASIYAK